MAGWRSRSNPPARTLAGDGGKDRTGCWKSWPAGAHAEGARAALSGVRAVLEVTPAAHAETERAPQCLSESGCCCLSVITLLLVRIFKNFHNWRLNGTMEGSSGVFSCKTT